MTHVVCVGDLMVDVLARLPGPLAPGSDTPAPVTFAGGGAGANVACWLAETGARATFVGRVGDDPVGAAALDALRIAGVQPAVAVDPERPTGTCIVLVAPDGERTMIPSGGANHAPLDLRLLPDGADALYLSGYSLLADAVRPSALTMLEIARRRGCAIAVDAATAAPLRAAPEFLAWLGHDVLLLANSDEARVLTGSADPVQAARALGARCGAAVVKRGPGGACWSDGDVVHEIDAAPVAVVDTTGAGDAFAAGFLAARGRPVPEALAAARDLAARAVIRVGARP